MKIDKKVENVRNHQSRKIYSSDYHKVNCNQKTSGKNVDKRIEKKYYIKSSAESTNYQTNL